MLPPVVSALIAFIATLFRSNMALRLENSTFPRNRNAALPFRAQKAPLTLSGLKKDESCGTCGHELSRPKRVSWLLNQSA